MSSQFYNFTSDKRRILKKNRSYKYITLMGTQVFWTTFEERSVDCGFGPPSRDNTKRGFVRHRCLLEIQRGESLTQRVDFVKIQKQHFLQ